MRVVLDTNIIVSAYLGGALEGIIVAWKSGKFTLVVSKEIAEEYLEVLRPPRFKIEEVEVDDFAALLLDRADFVIPLESLHVINDDPTDNKFLEAAVAGERQSDRQWGRSFARTRIVSEHLHHQSAQVCGDVA